MVRLIICRVEIISCLGFLKSGTGMSTNDSRYDCQWFFLEEEVVLALPWCLIQPLNISWILYILTYQFNSLWFWQCICGGELIWSSYTTTNNNCWNESTSNLHLERKGTIPVTLISWRDPGVKLCLTPITQNYLEVKHVSCVTYLSTLFWHFLRIDIQVTVYGTN